MALSIKNLVREFSFNDTILPDPNPTLSPDEVMALYSGTYPELNNATLVGPEIVEDKQVFTFKTVLGTKG